MYIYSVTNQPAFGIKYTNKPAWKSWVLKTFQNSQLLKQIDKKYPEAEVTYSRICKSQSFINEEPIYTVNMDIYLDKNKMYRWIVSSHIEDYPDKCLNYEIDNMTLEYIEKQARDPRLIVEKKDRSIKAFFKKFF